MADQDQGIGVKIGLFLENLFSDLGSLPDKIKGKIPKVELDPHLNNEGLNQSLDQLKQKLHDLQAAQSAAPGIEAAKNYQHEIQQTQHEIDKWGEELSKVGNEGSGHIHKAGDATHHMGEEAEHAGGMFSHLSGIMLTAFAAFSAHSLMEGGEKFLAGQEALERGISLSVKGMKNQEEELDRINKASEKTAADLNVLPSHVKEVAAAVAQEGVTGKLNDDVTKLSAGIEQFTKGTPNAIQATAVIKGFLKGGEEGAEGLGRLNQAMPELAAKLQGITDPAEKVRVAMDYMGPGFEKLKEQAEGPLGKLEGFKNKIEDVSEKTGAFLITAAAPLITIMSTVADGVTVVSNVFETLPAPLGTVIKAVGGVVAVLILYSTAQKSSMIQTVAARTASIAGAVADNAKAIATGIATAATWLYTAATTALGAAMTFLASPIGIIIVAIAAVAAGAVWAYNQFDGFKKVVDTVWQGLQKFGQILLDIVAFWAKWLNPIGLAIQGLQALADKVGFVKDALNAVKSAASAVGDFFSGLFGSTEKVAEATEHAKTAAESEAEALKKQKDEVDKLTASLAKQQDQQDKSNRQEIDNAKTRIVQDEMNLANAEKMVAAGKMTKQAFAEYKKTIEDNIKAQQQFAKGFVDDVHAMEGFKAKADELLLGKDDPKKKKQADTSKKDLFAQYQEEKEIENAAFQQKQIDNEKAYTTGRITKKVYLDQVKQDQAEHNKNMLQLVNDWIADSQNVESGWTKKELELIPKFNSEKKTLTKQALDAEVALHDEQMKTEEEELGKHLAKQASIMKEAAYLLGADQFKIEKQVLIDNLAARRTMYSEWFRDGYLTQEEYDEKIKTLTRDTNDQLLQIEGKRIDKKKELDTLAIENSRKNDFQKRLALVDVETTAELDKLQNQLDLRLISHEEFELKKTAIVKKAAQDRLAIQKEELNQEGSLYKVASDAIAKIFQGAMTLMSGYLKHALGLDKAEKDKSAAEDKKRVQADNQTKEKSLEDQMRAGQISYQKYREELAKIQDTHNADEVQKEQAKSDAIHQIQAKLLEDSLANLTKFLAQYAQQMLQKMILDKSESIAGGIQGAFSTPAPFFAQLAIAVGVPLAIQGLFAGIDSLFASATPRAAGGDVKPGSLYLYGEHGPELGHFPAQGRLIDAETSASIMQNHMIGGRGTFRPGTFGAFKDTYNGNMLPRVAPALEQTTSSQMLSMQRENHKMFKDAVDQLTEKGIAIHGKVSGEDIFWSQRKYGKSIDRRAYSNNN